MKILNIQLSLFEEVPTTIRGGERCSMAHGNYRCVCGRCVKAFQPGGKKSKMTRAVCLEVGEDHSDLERPKRPQKRPQKRPKTKWYLISNICNMDYDKTRCCGNCALCVHTYLGSECGLTDNPVDDNQAACIDYIPED